MTARTVEPRFIVDANGDIYDETNPVPTLNTPSTSNTGDLSLDIPAGNLTGTSSVNKFGRNPNVGTTLEDVWDGGGTYSWPSSDSITHVRAAVDSVATQGMTLEVQGLDTNWALVVQPATLDGTDSTTEVALSTPLLRCFRMKNTSASDNDQLVQAGPTGFATINAQITINANQTLMGLYTVPAGKTAYVTNVWASDNKSNTNGAVDATFWARSEGGVFRVQRTTGLQAGGSSHVQHFFKPYAKYTEKTDLRCSAICSNNGHEVSSGFDLILVDD